ncbi:MAG: DUF1294 domain-containing protein [Ruminococcaceae bacterium]|nr:DUF1294 domain-containing protein [Oscillospiraceae bacterium]
MNKLWFLLLIWNLIVFFIYGLDKFFAKKGLRRIRETTLITFSFFLGAFGAMFGMVMFNHKTSKIKFRILVPLSAFFNVLLIILTNNYLL